MSLWTPQGEHPVPDDRPSGPQDQDAAPQDAIREEDLTDEQREQLEAMAEELADAQRRLAAVPAAQVVANHAIGLFELAAIHLHAQPPHFDEASLAIDALAAVVDGLGDRLESHEGPLRDALAQIRLAFVQLRSASQATQDDEETSSEES
jgi:hypothetical protein